MQMTGEGGGRGESRKSGGDEPLKCALDAGQEKKKSGNWTENYETRNNPTTQFIAIHRPRNFNPFKSELVVI